MSDYTANEGSDNVISLAPLPPRQTKPPWCLASFFFFFAVFPPVALPESSLGLLGSGTGLLDESSPSPPPDIGFASRVFETSVRWSPEPFCAANQHMRSELGRAPRPLPAVWPVRHPKTVRSRPRFGRRFFFLCFYFVFRPSQAARRPGCERQRRRSSTLQCISSHTASWRPPNMAIWRRPPPPRPNFCRSSSSRLSTRNPTPSKPWDQARHGAGYRKYDTTTRPI